MQMQKEQVHLAVPGGEAKSLLPQGATPGPWTVRLWATDEPDPELAASKGISIRRVPMLTNDGARIIMHGQGEDSTRVAVVECQTPYKRGQGHQTECAERDANAHLIAAAPDLLAACQAQHRALDVLMARLIGLDPTFRPTKSEVWPALVQGNEAIAKASA